MDALTTFTFFDRCQKLNVVVILIERFWRYDPCTNNSVKTIDATDFHHYNFISNYEVNEENKIFQIRFDSYQIFF